MKEVESVKAETKKVEIKRVISYHQVRENTEKGVLINFDGKTFLVACKNADFKIGETITIESDNLKTLVNAKIK